MSIRVPTQTARLRAAVVVAAGVSLLASSAADAEAPRRLGDSSVFAVVPPPGNPEGVVINGNTVLTGTTIDGFEIATGGTLPSRIFAFDRRSGALRYSIEIEGEDLRQFHGVAGLALDRDGRLYASVLQLGILRFDLGRGARTQELYATLPDLPPCAVALGAPCSPTADDRMPLGNDIVFDPAGTLYVSDSWQGTIFRIPAGGGAAEMWFQDPRIDGVFGANGIRISADKRHLYVAVTEDRAGISRIYRLPLVARPQAGDLEGVASWPVGGADGIALGATGRLYVVLGDYDEISVLRPDGTEEVRYASEHFHNPASLAFTNEGSLLITNHAFFDPEPSHSSLVELFVGEKGAPLARPDIP